MKGLFFEVLIKPVNIKHSKIEIWTNVKFVDIHERDMTLYSERMMDAIVMEIGSLKGNWTPVSAVRGQCPNH